jgi:hypothetical protein
MDNIMLIKSRQEFAQHIASNVFTAPYSGNACIVISYMHGDYIRIYDLDADRADLADFRELWAGRKLRSSNDVDYDAAFNYSCGEVTEELEHIFEDLCNIEGFET